MRGTDPDHAVEPTTGVLPGSRQLVRALDGFVPPVSSDDELAVVVLSDASATMAVWQPTVAALERMLEQHRAFRAVRGFTIEADGPHVRDRDGRRHRAADLLEPAGRQIFLVFTDGMGPLWTDTRLDRVLRLWGASQPIAIVNPFPQGYWYRTNFLPRRAELRAPHPLAANQRYQVKFPTQLCNPFHPPPDERSLPIPILELDGRWLGWWAALVMGGERWVDSLVHNVDPSARMPEREGTSRRESPANVVLRFRSGASPIAFRLATYIAAAPLELPLLRRLQQALLPGSAPHHLAEVVTSDLFRQTDDPTAPLQFAVGVREALLACAIRDDSAWVARTVGLDFTQAIDDPDNAPVPLVTTSTLPHAQVELAVMSALSGPYSRRAKRLREQIAAVERLERQPAGATTAGERIPSGAPHTGGHGNGDDMSDAELSQSHGSSLSRGGAHPGEPSLADDVEQVVAALDPLVRPGHEAGPAVWGDIPTRNPVFTGRRELLEQLDRRLRSRGVAAVLPQALHGEGGVGKSHIAIEYAYRHKSDYDIIWWVPSERPAQVLDSLTKLGERLGLDIGADVLTALPRIREALRAGSPYPNWLLIFDNAEDLDSVRQYFPDSGTGKVLVTSRNRAWGEITDILEVDVFSREESISLLRRRNLGLTESDADQLAEALGDLPLAIEHGSAWLASTGMAAEDYLALLARKRSDLTDLGQSPGHEMPVTVAASIALDRLTEENPAAVQLLEICSFFAPEPISRNLFTASRGTQTFTELDDALQDPTRFNRAIRDIQRYLLASIDHRANTIQLHRLVQTVLRGRIPAERLDAVEHGAHVVLAGGMPGDPADRNHWKQYQALASHLTASRAVTCADDWTRGLVLLLIAYFFFSGYYGPGRALAQDVVDRWRAMPTIGPDHRQTLKAAKWLGYYLWTDGRFHEAADILHDTLERYRRILGADDDGTLDAMTMVASSHRAVGRFDDARQLDQEAYDRAKRIYREDDPETLRAAHNLGVSLRLVGAVREARRLDTDTYTRRERALGADHPETLRTLNSLVIDERECGNYVRAHRMAEDLYLHYVGLFGPGHPETIKIARNLAVARRRGGDHDGAFKLAEETMNRFRERFGATHPETIAATLNFAVDIRETGDLPRARTLAAQTAQQYHSALGPDHPYTLYARTNLAIVLRLLGERQEAYAHNNAAWTTLTDLLGPAHILTLTCAVNHASDRAALGDSQGAYELGKDTLRRLRGLVGAEHPSTLACMLNMALDLVGVGRPDDGDVLLEDTIQVYRRVVGDGHPAVAAARDRARANCDVDPMPL